MPTNRQGKGTDNVSVNLLDVEREVFARLAIADDRSLGDEIRRLATAGLRTMNPDAAMKIEDARRQHRQQTLFKL